MEQALMHVITKFPDHVGKIIDLYKADEDFRELCNDFLISTEALAEHRINVVKDQAYEMHFTEIYMELEKEIVAVLKKLEKNK